LVQSATKTKGTPLDFYIEFSIEKIEFEMF